MRLSAAALGILLAIQIQDPAPAPQDAPTAEFFVATTGDDSNPGTEAKPFASLEAARNAIRGSKAQRKPSRGITVWIRRGDYARANAFELVAEDSGTKEAPVVYRSYPNETARLLGGRTLKDFRPVTDPAVLSRLDEAARGHVLQTDLRGQGIAEVGPMKSRGFTRAAAAHSELFFDGRPMTLARWPNEGEWEKIAGFPDTAGQGDDHGGKIGALERGFHYAGDRPRRWKDTIDLWVHGYWAWDWANSYEHVESLDLDRRLLKTAAPYGLYGFRQGQRFFYLNVLEELDQPGEYFVDRKKGLLYFWPPKPLDSSEAMLSTLEAPLIRMDQVSHVILRGLILEATRGNAVEIRGGEGDRIAGCAVRLIGDCGIVVEGGQGHHIIDSDIEDTGDGGVVLSGGDRQTLAPGGHVVENCHFQKQGRWSKCYVPAVLLSGVGHRVAHNLIHDHPHCAILFGGNDHLIEFNEIHHVVMETGDAGAIYSGRDWTCRGNRIRNNFIHHTGGLGMGSMGVYMDDCLSGTEIFGNIFYNVQRAVFLGGGRDHRVENNIFVDCRPAIQVDGRGLEPAPVWHDMVYDTMKKQLAAVPQDLYRRRYPALKDLDRYYGAPSTPSGSAVPSAGVPPENNVVARNICVGEWIQVGWHAKTEWLKLENNLIGGEPQFVEPGKMDFRLKPGSPALKLGFRSIPVEKIGLQDDELRRELKSLGARRRP